MKFNAENQRDAYEKIAALNNFPDGEVTITVSQPRITNKQHGAMRLWFEYQAALFNKSGIDKRTVLERVQSGIVLPWCGDSIEVDIWRPLQKAITGKQSIAKLERKDVSDIYLNINRWMNDVELPCCRWPSRFDDPIKKREKVKC